MHTPRSLAEKRPLLPRPLRNWKSDGLLKKTSPVLVLHGGAGTITRESSTPERLEAYRAALRAALRKGQEVLIAGGEAMDAAVAAVGVLEGEYH